MLAERGNAITLIYHSDKDEDRQMKHYLETIGGFEVSTIDLKRKKLTEKDLAEIADKLDVDTADLFDPGYTNRPFRSLKSIRKEDALKLLAQVPIMLATPILIIGSHAYQFESTYAFIQE